MPILILSPPASEPVSSLPPQAASEPVSARAPRVAAIFVNFIVSTFWNSGIEGWCGAGFASSGFTRDVRSVLEDLAEEVLGALGLRVVEELGRGVGLDDLAVG